MSSWYACTATIEADGGADAFSLAVLEAVRPYALHAEVRIDDDFASAPADATEAFESLTAAHNTWQRTLGRVRDTFGRPPVARVPVADDDAWARLLVCASWAHSVDVLGREQATVARVTDHGRTAVLQLPDQAAVALGRSLRDIGTMRSLAENVTWWTFSSPGRRSDGPSAP